MQIRRYVKASILGSLAAVAGSTMVSLLASLSAGYLEHPLESLPWLLTVSIGPSVLSALVLCRYAKRIRGSGRRIWLAALLSAIVTVVLAGSIGAVAVEIVDGSSLRMNSAGHLTWSVLYAIGLLPVSLPVALLVLHRILRDGDLSMPP